MTDSRRVETLADTRRMVVKVGTNVLAGKPFGKRRIAALASQVAELSARGISVVMVSSGAIGAGMQQLGLARRPERLPGLQAAAAVGQTQLMKMWDASLGRRGLTSAQVLLTRDDCSHRRRYLNDRNTLHELLDHGVVPVVNENDTISTDEIALDNSFGENDILAAMVANLVQADLLVMLTDVDGLHARTDRGLSKQPVDVVEAITPEIQAWVGPSVSGLGKGGMTSKLRAADMMVRSGEACAIVNGTRSKVLLRLLDGRPEGTLFLPGPKKLSARQRWIGFDGRASGSVVVDAGAVRALCGRGKSLLPSGIVEVKGHFGAGDIVIIRDEDGTPVARGLSNYDAREVRLIQGRQTDEIEPVLGSRPYDVVVHRDNLVLVGD